MENDTTKSTFSLVLYGLEICLCFYCIKWCLGLKQIIQEKGTHEAMAESVLVAFLLFIGGIFLLDILTRFFSYIKRRCYKELLKEVALSVFFVIGFYFLTNLFGR